MTQDTISDFIIRLKNAGDAGKESIVMPYSGVNLRIAELLEQKGYIRSQARKGKKAGECIEVELCENDAKTGKPRISGVKRRSKPSKREYVGADGIFSVRNGYGIMVVSTSKGVMSGEDAKKEKLGGEVLFEIW